MFLCTCSSVGTTDEVDDVCDLVLVLYLYTLRKTFEEKCKKRGLWSHGSMRLAI